MPVGERGGGSEAEGAVCCCGRGAKGDGAVVDSDERAASAVPVRVGVVSLVGPAPLVKVGVAGAVASICRLIAIEAGPVLPLASVARAVRV